MTNIESLFRVPKKPIHTMYDSGKSVAESELIKPNDLEKIQPCTREDLRRIMRAEQDLNLDANDPRIFSKNPVIINDFKNFLPTQAQAKRQHGDGYGKFIGLLRENIRKLEVSDGVAEIVAIISDELASQFTPDDLGQHLFNLKNDSKRKIGAVVFENPNLGLYFVNGKGSPHKTVFTGGQHLHLPDEIDVNQVIRGEEFDFTSGDVLNNFRLRHTFSPGSRKMVPTVNVMAHGRGKFSGLQDQVTHFQESLLVPLERIGGGELLSYRVEGCVGKDQLPFIRTQEDAFDELSRAVPPHRVEKLRGLGTYYRNEPDTSNGQSPFDDDTGVGFIVPTEVYNDALKAGEDAVDKLDEDVSNASLDAHPFAVRVANEGDNIFRESLSSTQIA